VLEISIGGVGIGVIVAALVYVTKKLDVSSRFLPLVSLVIGSALGLIAYFVGEMALTQAIISGGLIGLATSGSYDVIKSSVLGK